MSKYLAINVPSLWVIMLAAPLGLLWSYGCLSFAASLKSRLRFRTAYTRKVFHVLIFVSAVVVQGVGGFVMVCVFGAMVSIVVGYAVMAGSGNRLYEAIAREQDGRYRTYYVVIPYFATLIGGLTSNILFGPLAVVGYLVGGLGDAAGEPFGARWGKRRFAQARKTIEGSVAVVATSIVALLIAVAIRPEFHLSVYSWIAVPVIGIICGFVEAFSPRGWDNVPMQIVPTVLAVVLLTR
jgi:phytol kinase